MGREAQRVALDDMRRDIGVHNDLEAMLCQLRHDLNVVQSSLTEIRKTEANWRDQAQQEVEASRKHVVNANDAMKDLITNLSNLSSEVRPALVQMAAAVAAEMDMLLDIGGLREKQDTQSKSLRNELERLWEEFSSMRQDQGQDDFTGCLRETESIIRDVQQTLPQQRRLSAGSPAEKGRKCVDTHRGHALQEFMKEERARWSEWATEKNELCERWQRAETHFEGRVNALESQLSRLHGLSPRDHEKVSAVEDVGDSPAVSGSKTVRFSDAVTENRNVSAQIEAAVQEMSTLRAQFVAVTGELGEVRNVVAHEKEERRMLTAGVERLVEDVEVAVAQSLRGEPQKWVEICAVDPREAGGDGDHDGYSSLESSNARTGPMELDWSGPFFGSKNDGKTTSGVTASLATLDITESTCVSAKSSLSVERVPDAELHNEPSDDSSSPCTGCRGHANVSAFSDGPLRKRANMPTMSWEMSSRAVTPVRQAISAEIPGLATGSARASPNRAWSPPPHRGSGANQCFSPQNGMSSPLRGGARWCPAHTRQMLVPARTVSARGWAFNVQAVPQSAQISS